MQLSLLLMSYVNGPLVPLLHVTLKITYKFEIDSLSNIKVDKVIDIFKITCNAYIQALLEIYPTIQKRKILRKVPVIRPGQK